MVKRLCHLYHMNEILDGKGMDRALTRIAHEIIENNKGVNDIILLGIKTRGVFIAERIIDKIEKIEGIKVPFDTVDISFYRDDLKKISQSPQVKDEIHIDVKDRIVILVDDVMYTGRTCRSAMDAVFKAGRAKKIQFAALVDRGHRELPIAPNYVGKNLPTSKDEVVTVKMMEIDNEDCVVIEKIEK